MEIVIYFVGFIMGVITLVARASLDLPFWAGSLFCAGCIAIGLIIIEAIKAFMEGWTCN